MAWKGRNKGYVKVEETDIGYKISVYNRVGELVDHAFKDDFNSTIEYCYYRYMDGYDVPLDYLPDSVLVFVEPIIKGE